jgi:hypothetical protein
MIRRGAFWMATVLAMLAATSAWAAEDVFHAIPSDALAFVAANRIGETSAKIEKVARQVGATPVKLLNMIKEHTGEIKGLDDSRGAALVVMSGEDEKDEPSRVLLVPVTDYKKFLESWNAKPTEKIVEVTIADEPMLIARRGDYAAVSRKQVGDVDFRPGLEKLLNAKRSVADEYPQILSWLTENDVVAVATSRGLKRASEAMQEQLQQMKDIVARMNMDEDASAPVALLETYVKIFRDAEKGINLLAVAARVDKQGNLHVTKRVRFRKSSEVAPSLAKLRPIEKGPLTGTPAGPFVLAGGGPWSDLLSRGILTLQSGFLKQTFRKTYDIDEKQTEELVKKSLEMPKGIHSVSLIMGPGQPGEPTLSDTVILFRVDDAAKYLDEYEKYLATMNEPGKDAKSAKKLFSAKRTKIGGRPALENEMVVLVPPKAAGIPGFDERIGKLLGSEAKVKILLAAIDDHTVALSGRAPAIMRAIASLKKPADSLASDPEIAKTAALLPAGAQWVGYVSPIGAVAFAKSIVAAMNEEGFKPGIPDFPASQPIGVAVQATAGQLQIETVVPSSVLDAIGKFVGLMEAEEHPEVP